MSLSAACACLVAVGCVAASARRLWFAVNPTELDASVVRDALGARPSRADVERLAPRIAPFAWERDLVAAILDPDGPRRAALVNEQLSELDWRMQRWVRVPRVGARVSFTLAVIFASIGLREALGDPALDPDFGANMVHGPVADALAVIVVGLAGTLFCVAAHGQARRLVRRRQESTDRLVEALEKAADGA